MPRLAFLFAVLATMVAAPAAAQVVVTPRTVIIRTAPAPGGVTYGPPVLGTPGYPSGPTATTATVH